MHSTISQTEEDHPTGCLLIADSSGEEGEAVAVLLVIVGEEVVLVVAGEAVVVIGEAVLLVVVIGEAVLLVVVIGVAVLLLVVIGAVVLVEDRTFSNKMDEDQTIFISCLKSCGRGTNAVETEVDEIRASSDETGKDQMIASPISILKGGGKGDKEEIGEEIEEEEIVGHHQRETSREDHRTMVVVVMVN